MPWIRQTRFTGGELAPYLHGRSDLPLHSSGAAYLRNFIPLRQGPLVTRSGTVMVCRTYSYFEACRLVPYVFSDALAFVLQLEPGRLRVIYDGAQVESSPGVPVEVATVYGAGDLKQLQWAQQGDRLILTCPGIAPQQVRRSSAGTWTISDALEERLEWVSQSVRPDRDAYAAPMFVQVSGVDNFSDTPERPAREWIWKASNVVRQLSTGLEFETQALRLPATWFDGVNVSSAYTALNGDKVVLAADRPVTIRQVKDGSTLYSTDYEVVRVNYFRGRGDLFGFVGSTTSTEFVDVGDEPNYALPPPRGDRPLDFAGLPPAGAEYPRAVAYFQDRRAFSGPTGKDATVFFSATGDYPNHDQILWPFAGQPLEYALACRRRESIRAMLGGRRLVVGTDSSVWTFGGAEGTPLDFDSVEARVEDEVGVALGLPLLLVDATILYVRSNGRGARALVPNDWGGLTPSDVVSHAQHLFLESPRRAWFASYDEGAQVLDWCHAEEPWGLVWACRRDGALLSLTYDRSAGVAAWARHDFVPEAGVYAGGYGVKSVCAIPEGDEDGVYMVVRRTHGQFVERFSSRVLSADPDTHNAVDCAVRFEGTYGTTAQTLGGLSHLEGQSVWVVAKDNEPMGPLTVTGGAVTCPRAFTANKGTTDTVAFVGLRFVPQLVTLPVAQTDARGRQKTVTQLALEVDSTKGLSVGQDLQHLELLKARNVSDAYGAVGLQTELVRVPIRGTWDKGATAALEVSIPAPCAVLSVLREVDVGD